MATDPDYHFTAVRRGEALVICGKVLGPPGATAILKRGFNPSLRERGFRLAYENNNGALPWVPHDFVHIEPDVPAAVDTLRIRLPTDDDFVIESRNKRKDAPPATGSLVKSEEIAFQIEQMTIPGKVLEGLARELMKAGFRGLVVIRPHDRTKGYFVVRWPRRMDRTVAAAFPLRELDDPYVVASGLSQAWRETDNPDRERPTSRSRRR